MKGKLPAGFRWAGNTLTDGSLRLSIEDSGDSLRVEYDTSYGMVGSAANTIVWAYVPAVAALLRACGWKATPPGGPHCLGVADPRDARIAELEAALGEALELADEGWAYADEYFRSKWDYRERADAIRALLAKPGGRDGT